MDSLWITTSKDKNEYSSLEEDISVDVCVIGAGIFGLTSAYFLSKLGYRVAVLEKDSIGQKATGHTTAKITSQHGLFYDYLLSSYGESFAKDYLEANESAITGIKEIIDEEKISCHYEVQNSYVYATQKSELPLLQKEMDALSTLDFPAQFVTQTGLPFSIEGAICFPNQAQFHPLEYLFGLARSITQNSGTIYTDTTASDVKKEDDSYLTYSNGHVVRSSYVIVATHYPFINIPGFYFTKMYQSTSYLIAVDTKKTLHKGMYLSCQSPVFSFRTVPYDGKRLLLIGGGEHRTGETTSYSETYGTLEDIAHQYFPHSEVLYRWNTRDCISLDKIPYVGVYSDLLPHIFLGTGFKKWGMTSSYVAAKIVTDQITGKKNEYAYVFDSGRFHPIKDRVEVKNIVVKSSESLLFNKLKRSSTQFNEIPTDSGGIVEINKQKVGIYKDNSGDVFAVKPVCTHLGCLLSWNDIDKTWDCPCHGSRFDHKGVNLYDPAFKNLDIYDLDD